MPLGYCWCRLHLHLLVLYKFFLSSFSTAAIQQGKSDTKCFPSSFLVRRRRRRRLFIIFNRCCICFQTNTGGAMGRVVYNNPNNTVALDDGTLQSVFPSIPFIGRWQRDAKQVHQTIPVVASYRIYFSAHSYFIPLIWQLHDQHGFSGLHQLTRLIHYLEMWCLIRFNSHKVLFIQKRSNYLSIITANFFKNPFDSITVSLIFLTPNHDSTGFIILYIIYYNIYIYI